MSASHVLLHCTGRSFLKRSSLEMIAECPTITPHTTPSGCRRKKDYKGEPNLTSIIRSSPSLSSGIRKEPFSYVYSNKAERSTLPPTTTNSRNSGSFEGKAVKKVNDAPPPRHRRRAYCERDPEEISGDRLAANTSSNLHS